MKQKFYKSDGETEYTLFEELELAYWFSEFPEKNDYTDRVAADINKEQAKIEYFIARGVYKKLSKIFKDTEIANLYMLSKYQNVENN